MAVIRSMTDIMQRTGHDCPKNSRRFCWEVLGLRWKKGRPAVDEDLFNERMRAYNEGTLDTLLAKSGSKARPK